MQVRHRAGTTVILTFDNLGEVADLERGRWPADAPLGRHASVTRTLPRILSLLEDAGVRATFFVEGLNAELYPDALTEIAAAATGKQQDPGHQASSSMLKGRFALLRQQRLNLLVRPLVSLPTLALDRAVVGRQ